MKELVAEVAKIEVPAVLASSKAKRKSETPKTTSLEPSPQRMSTRKTKKEPKPELSEEEEEAESSEEERVDNSSEEPESEEEAKPATPLLEKKKKMETRASDKKKPASAFKTLTSQKKPVKTPKKGESSQKK